MKNLITITLLGFMHIAVFSQEASLPFQGENTTNTIKSDKKVDMLQLRKMSSDEIRSYLVNNFDYPEYLRENAIGGLFKMNVEVGTSGQIKQIKVLESPHEMLKDSISDFLVGYPVKKSNNNGKAYTTQVVLLYTIDPF